MALKDGTTSKNMLSRGLTSLVDSHKNKASLAAGPAAAAAAATAAAAAAGFHNVPLATPKHHANEGRNNIQKHAAPRLDVPSGSFWIQRLQLLGLLLQLLKTKRVQLLGLLLLLVLLELVLQASKTHPSPHRNTMLLKDGTTSKNMLRRRTTFLQLLLMVVVQASAALLLQLFFLFLLLYCSCCCWW